MKIQKGIVKYKDRNDIVCTYGITDDNTNYYFLDLGHDYKLPNGNIIASTELVEAIDPMYQASHVGVINEEGKIILPFTHKSIRLIDDKYVLVELAQPISESVLEANQMRKDPTLATKLVSTPALIKEHLNSKMEGQGRYLFNDQFSEATICNLDGENLLDGEYYSFIAETAGKLYFSKNTVDSEIKEFSTLPVEVQNDVVESTSQEIDVSDVQVPTEVVENAMTDSVSSETQTDENKFGEELIEESQAVGAVTEAVQPETVNEEVVEEEKETIPEEVVEASPQDSPVEETVSQEVVETAVPSEENVPEEVVEASPQDSLVEETVSQELEEDAPVEDVGETEQTLKIAADEDNEMEETPDTAIDEADEEEVELDDKVEDSSLDDLFHTANQYYEEEEDPLKDYKIETDVIEPVDEYDTPVEDYSDSIVSDVAKYMKALLEQNRDLLEQNDKLLKQNDQLKESLEKALASRKLLFDKSSVQDKQIEALKGKISKLEKANRDQGKVIEAQAKDRLDLERILSNVKDVLGEDTYSYDSIYTLNK